MADQHSTDTKDIRAGVIFVLIVLVICGGGLTMSIRQSNAEHHKCQAVGGQTISTGRGHSICVRDGRVLFGR